MKELKDGRVKKKMERWQNERRKWKYGRMKKENGKMAE